MALRSGHGTGKGVPRIEVLPVDELPAGVAAPSGPLPARDDAGKVLPGAGAAQLGKLGGQAASESRQLANLLGIRQIPDDHPYAPYTKLARRWRDAHMSQLASTVGAGSVGPGPASIVASAALQLAASRYLADLGATNGDAKMLLDASKLANESRQNLLAAHELCAGEAKSQKQKPPAWFTSGDRE